MEFGWIPVVIIGIAVCLFIMSSPRFAGYIPHCLAIMYSMCIVAAAAFLLGDTNKWKANWSITIAITAIVLYIVNVVLGMKTARAMFFYEDKKDGKRIWFLGVKNLLEILVPILYICLAYACLMEFAVRQQHLEKSMMPEVLEVVKWRSTKYWFQMSILISGGLLAAIGAWKINYYRQADQDRIPMETINDFPKKWNEVILKDAPVGATENATGTSDNDDNQRHATLTVADQSLDESSSGADISESSGGADTVLPVGETTPTEDEDEEMAPTEDEDEEMVLASAFYKNM